MYELCTALKTRYDDSDLHVAQNMRGEKVIEKWKIIYIQVFRTYQS